MKIIGTDIGFGNEKPIDIEMVTIHLYHEDTHVAMIRVSRDSVLELPSMHNTWQVSQTREQVASGTLVDISFTRK